MIGTDWPGAFQAFLLDVDGVLTRGSRPLPGAADALSELQHRGTVALLTNNSTRSREALSRHLDALDMHVPPHLIFTSSFLVARLLAKHAGLQTVWVVGEAGLREELTAEGHRLADDPEEADWVVAGMDRHLSYATLQASLDALRHGASLAATNEDPTYPTPEGLAPGAGAVIGALRGMGYPPALVAGKPHADAYDIAVEQLSIPREKILMIGDRLETDIAGGRNAGIATALVLSGVSSMSHVRATGIAPTWIADHLGDIAVGRVQAASRLLGDDPALHTMPSSEVEP